MISKSTKAKRRRLANYYDAVRGITVTLIDERDGPMTNRFYLVSVALCPPQPTLSGYHRPGYREGDPYMRHEEADDHNLLEVYRRALRFVRMHTDRGFYRAYP